MKSEKQPKKNWTEDLDSLNKLPPLPNKRVRETKTFLTEDDYKEIAKRLDNIERQLNNINLRQNTRTINQLRRKINQIEGDANGSPSRPQTDTKQVSYSAK